MSRKQKTILAFFVTAVILTLFMPTRGVFKFRYIPGEQWKYQTLISEFDFPILKSQEELKRDYDRFETNFIPIYRLDRAIPNEVLQNIMSEYDLTLDLIQNGNSTGLSARRNLGIQLYKVVYKIYDHGIISVDKIKDAEVIRIVKDGVISTTSSDYFYSIKSAIDSLNTRIYDNILGGEKITDLDKYIGKNVILDNFLTSAEKESQRKSISISKGFIPKGAVLIKESEIIDKEKMEVLNSYKSEHLKRGGQTTFGYLVFGNMIYVFIILSLNYFFFIYFRSEFSKNLGNILFILFIYIAMMILTNVISRFDSVSLYIIPFAIVPLYVVTFYDIRMSIFEFISVLLICTVSTPLPFELLFLNLTAGLAGVFVLQNSYHRTRVFFATGAILLTYFAGYIAISMMQHETITTIDWSYLLWFVANVVILLALYQLIYIFEHIFGFVTNITLFELCDTNHPLLQELAHKAPGTFQHSLQVANLAEAAAKQIGANHLYARTGALYHDIGKMENPIYFIENLTGEFNPHNALEPIKSVEYIKQHVIDGVNLAKKNKLPSIIADFITTHHGTSKIYFFYHAYVQKYGEPTDQSLFSYQGPTPSSKEATICMMADGIEAASRSLKEFTSDSLNALVDKIVETQISENQFELSPLSLHEITIIKDVFKTKLSTIYHTRIEYPDRIENNHK